MVSVSFDDSRIDVGADAEVRYKLQYDYDDVAFDDTKGTVTGFTWDSGNNWWDKAITASSSVGSTNYDETDISFTDSTYGLTAIEDVAGADLITDRITFLNNTLETTDSRLNYNDNGKWYAKLKYEYDDSEVTDGSVSLNTGSMTWYGTDLRWEYTYSKGSVGAETKNIASVAGNTYGITALNSAVTSDSETIVFDRIKILTLSAVDANISVGDEGIWYATAELEYNNYGLGSGDSFTLSGYAFSWNSTDNRFEATDNKSSAQTVTINSFDSGSEATYGITAGNINNLSQSIEWQAVSSGGGGGGMPSAWFNPPQAPEAGFRVFINNDAKYTDSPVVNLDLFGGSNTAGMAISNFSDFRDAGQETYQTTKSWNLCQSRESCSEDEYTVYVKFYTDWGTASEIVSDSIIYRKGVWPPTEIIEKISEQAQKISEKAGEVAKKITELFKPTPPEEIKPPEVPVEEIVSKEAPLTMQGKWDLLSYLRLGLPFEKFISAPLPREFQKLAEKLPELGKIFTEVGIQQLIDIEKLRAVKLTLPGLTERLGLPTAKVEPGKFALPEGVPVAELSPEVKKQIPSEIVFAKTGGQLIDFNIALTLTEKGKPQQKITTISGKPLDLAVKPEKPVKSIKGYIVFKSKKAEPSSFQFPLNSLTASLIFTNPDFAQIQEKPIEVEERLVLMEFEYTDPDGDGIYTAEIQAPIVEGEYEIITVMDYEEIDLGKKEIRLITVVDPEGYVYEKTAEKETRIPGAIVSLFWLNPETKQYELWPAKEFQQENPQITDATGNYAFLVPEGNYYLKVVTPGYLSYDGKPFKVTESSGIHVNIELKTKYWFLKIIDWKTILLILVAIFLFYNFYRDRMRERRQAKNV